MQFKTGNVDSDNSYFAGTFEQLRQHWENDTRSKKFLSGGTRSDAVKYVMDRLQTQIHKSVWIDLGVGAGYVQTLIDENASPTYIIGLDISDSMLRIQKQDHIERIQGTNENVPLRKGSCSLTSSFFSFSDYPTLRPFFEEMARITRTTGIICYMDYAEDDEYWNLRVKKHGKQDEDGNKIIGNINRRRLETIKSEFSDGLNIVFQTKIQYSVETKNFKTSFELPEKLTRKFSYTEVYKPREKTS